MTKSAFSLLSLLKFNRCITSQLIKWFSNFREFYYIQMEKFARQAINDGVTGADELSVSRDCELFRALNMHYNKANDFEVSPRPFALQHSPYITRRCVRYYFESFLLMLAQLKALKLIQLNDLFI